jgi:hypothetical protein
VKYPKGACYTEGGCDLEDRGWRGDRYLEGPVAAQGALAQTDHDERP